MTDNLNLHLWVARRAEQGTLQAHADYVVENIKLLEQAVKYEADLAQQALDSRAELAAEVKKYHDAWLEAEAQVVELGAKLAKAVEGLQDVAKEFSKPDAGLTDFGERQHYLFLTCKLRDKARTTLAELKGQDDEL